MRDGADHERPRFVGSASGIHFIRTVYDTLAKAPGRAQEDLAPQENLVPGEDDQLQEPSGILIVDTGVPSHKRPSFWIANELLPEDHASDQHTFEQLVKWSRSYFENWHSVFPFLHAPKTLQILELISLDGINTLPAAQAVIVRSIVSISLADSRQSSASNSAIPPELVFRDAENLASQVEFALIEPASLQNLQALLAAQLFLVSQLRFNFASRLGGLILRMALHLGLHRCPSRYCNFNGQEAQIRQRVFWSIYCIERMLCQSLGLPLDIQDDDVDVCYFDNEIHQKESQSKSQTDEDTTSSM